MSVRERERSSQFDRVISKQIKQKICIALATTFSQPNYPALQLLSRVCVCVEHLKRCKTSNLLNVGNMYIYIYIYIL